MAALRFDAEQRFTCQQCGRCCRRGWDIALTPGEVAAYRKAGAERLFRETEDGPEGAAADPFEPLASHAGFMRIRKRADGACGFLSPQNRCRIHEELGAHSKPLTCRLFPFRLHPADGPPLVTVSFCCPTVARNEGAPLAAQARDLNALGKEWFREYPEKEVPGFELVRGRRLTPASLGALRRALRQMLDRPGPEGPPDLARNAARMASLVEDLTRWRVRRLRDDAFAEYLDVVSTHAARSEQPVVARTPSGLARLFLRGFLFITLAARMHLEADNSRHRAGLRFRLFALLAHCHGLGPAVSACDLGAARRARVDLADPALRPLAWNYMRAQIETLGTGRSPVLDELAIATSQLSVARVLAAMRAGRAGRSEAGVDDFREALMDASDLAHAGAEGVLGRILATLASAPDALWILASGPRLY